MLPFFAGERYDIVLETSQTPGPYWIHVKGLSLCTLAKIYQLGVLQYEDEVAKNVNPSPDPGFDGFHVENPRVSDFSRSIEKNQ